MARQRCRLSLAHACAIRTTPSPMPPIAATSCCCRPATTSSAARSPSRRASLSWRCCRPSSLGRLPARACRSFALGDGARGCRQPALLRRLCVLVAAGFFGSRDPLSNPLPLTVWTLLWVGLTLVQGAVRQSLGMDQPVVRAVAVARFPAVRRSADAGDCLRGSATGRLLLFVGFAWFELIDPAPDDPARLASAVGLYWLLSFAAMLVFGYARLEPARRVPVRVLRHGVALRRRRRHRPAANGGRMHRLCLPGAKLCDAAPLPLERHAFLLLALASVSFDGLSKTFFWLGLNGVNPLEFPGRTAMIGINSVGLVLTLRLLAAAFFLCHLSSASGWPAAGNRFWPGGRAAGLVDRADRARLSFRALSDRAAGQRPICAGRAVRPVRAGLEPVRHRRHGSRAPASPSAPARHGCVECSGRRRSSAATCSPCWSRMLACRLHPARRAPRSASCR